MEHENKIQNGHVKAFGIVLMGDVHLINSDSNIHWPV